MARLFCLLAICCALFLARTHANTLTLYSSTSDLKYFAFNTPAYATFGAYVQPCSQQDCCGSSSCPTTSNPGPNCAGHAYCGTDPVTDSCTSADEQITVNILLGIEFACCWDDADTLERRCGDTGGKVGGFVTTSLSTKDFTLPNNECYNYPTDVATDAAAWQWLGTQNLNTLIQPLCESNTKGWTLALSRSYARAYATAAIADITYSGNNNVDSLYFYGHFGITTGASAVPPFGVIAPTWDGPTTGIQAGVLCTPTTDNVPPPTVAPGAAVCTSQCGCYFMNLLNKTNIGTDAAPKTRFTFQVCILCEHGFSYLTVCTGGLPMTGVQGAECRYGIDETTKGGCQVIKWANPSCPFQFLNGACDIISIDISGPTDGYVFNFGGHAGQGQTVVPITIDTSACTCGSQCMPTTPPATTTTVAASTTPGETTTQGPPPTDSNGSTLPETSTVQETTTQGPPPTDTNGSPLPTTTAAGTTTTPPSTTPNPCDQYSHGPNCDCIYTDLSGPLQAWCQPDGLGDYVWKLVEKEDVPIDAAAQGWYQPGSFDGKGYKLSCRCTKGIKQCPVDCTGDKCICDTAKGICVQDPVCNIVTNTPAPGATCPPCPVDANGAECSNHGTCNCGICVCGQVAGTQANYTGADCSAVAGCAEFEDCDSCLTQGKLQYGCTWCNYGAGARCLTEGACTTIAGTQVACDGTILFEPVPCPDNCSSNGICATTANITQCICKRGYHGANCAARGGLSAAAKAAAISGGVIAAIVICGVIVLVLVTFGAKKGVDFIALRQEASAKSHINPMYHDTNANASSGIYEHPNK